VTGDCGQAFGETPLLAAVGAAIATHGLLRSGDRVLVAVSGGPDSVALLHALTLLRPGLALELRVGHVHHGLRAEADHDAEFVERLAARFGCPVTVERVSVRLGAGRSPEEAARVARHAALDRAATACGATRVALGHTADDQAETVLMRVLQGASPRGLAGMPVRRGRLIRPLLGVDRAAVLAHLTAHGLPWVEDATNLDPKFLRNRLRRELLPLLAAQGWPRVPEALRRLARTSRETVEALDALLAPRVSSLLRPVVGGSMVDLGLLADLPPGAVKALLRRAIEQATGTGSGACRLREPHLVALHALVDSAVGARVRLPRGVMVERARDGLWIAPRTGEPDAVPVAVPGDTAFPGAGLRLRVEAGPPAAGFLAEPSWEVRFDANALGSGPVLRTSRPGDRIVPFGGDRPVRVSRLLAAAGVPRAARRRWPLLVAGEPGREEVLWVVGVRRGATAPVVPASRLMLRVRAVPSPELVPKEEPS